MEFAQPLSHLNRRLIEELRRSPPVAAPPPDEHGAAIPAFMREYPFPVSTWPIFISQQVVREQFDPLIAAMPRVAYAAIHAYFGNDSSSFKTYFGWPQQLYHVLQRMPVDPRELLLRYDAVLGADGLKLLEINCCSSLGGCELDYFQSRVKSRLERYPGTRDWRVGYRQVLPAMLQRLVDGILRHKPRKSRGHLLFHSSLRFAMEGTEPRFDGDARDRDSFGRALQVAYDSIRPTVLPYGRAVLFDDFKEIGFAPSGEVIVRGEIMDAVILAGTLATDVPEDLLRRLTIAHLARHIVFPDSPLYILLGDKRLFALLHDCRARGLLAAADAVLVERYVPWTVRLRVDAMAPDGTAARLTERLLSRKDEFVLKKADSYSGKHVVVGRHVDTEQWQAAISRGLQDDLWIAQQFCGPGRLETYDGASAIVPHDLIWGIFSFGGEYSGAFIRARPSGNHAGVINAGTGATEFLVFEETADGQPAAASADAEREQEQPSDTGNNLSATNDRLLARLQQDASLRAQMIDTTSPTTVGFLRDYDATVSPWPVFVSNQIVNGPFREIVASVPKLFDNALRAYFKQDSRAFADYFGWPKRFYDLLVRIAAGPRDLFCRYDVVLAGSDVKVLELNCGSSAGGWQGDWLLPAVHEALRRCPEATLWNVQYRAIFAELLQLVIRSLERHKGARARGHIVLYAFVDGTDRQESLRQCLQVLYDSLKPRQFAAGRIILIRDFTELSFSPRREVIVGGESIDAVLLTFREEVSVPPAILEGLNVAYLANQIVFPDNPFHMVFGNKLMFAVAHEACELGLLTPDDTRAVQRYIPWTATLRERSAEWRGVRASLPDLLVANKEAFVLKQAESFGGRHVHVGRYTSRAEWTAAIAAGLSAGGWIAQEFRAPGKLLACHPTSGITAHELVWGVFGFGDQYGGAFVRARPVQGTNGVINSANGAIEHLVFEDLA
jgi:hypothetical protein